MRIAIGADHLEHAVGHFQHRHVERAAAEIEHDDFFVLFAFQTVGQRGCCRLVDYAGHFEAGNLAGVFGGLPLRIVEVCRYGNDCLIHLVAQIGFGSFFELAQNAGRNLLRCVFFIPHFHFDVFLGSADDLIGDDLLFRADFAVPPAHEAFDRIDGFLRIGDRLAAGQFAHEHVPLVGERDDAGRKTVAFLIRNDLGFFTFHYRDDRVGRAEVDADDFFSRSHG